MRLSIQVDSGATPYSARIPSAVVALLEGEAAAVVTTVACGNSNWFDGGEATPVEDEGEVTEAADEDDDDEEGDGADELEEDGDDFLRGRCSKRSSLSL